MTRRTLALTDPLYDYLLEVSVREPDLLTRLRNETGQLDNACMQISPEQGQFMRAVHSPMPRTRTRRAITSASSLSVFARRPMALA